MLCSINATYEERAAQFPERPILSCIADLFTDRGCASYLYHLP